jgi:hypothetical protein
MIKLEQIKHYLGTGLAFQLQNDMHDEFYMLEDFDVFQKAFSKGSIWKMVGYTDIDIPAGEGDLIGTIVQHESGIYTDTQIGVKPLMYRLSDLGKFIPELGFVPIEELLKIRHRQWLEKTRLSDLSISIKSVPNWIQAYFKYMATVEVRVYINQLEEEPFWVIQKLFEWNFWVFDQSLFDKGLIIDKLKQ